MQVTVGEEEDADFTIRDGFLGTPAPVREIMDRVLAASGKTFAFDRKPGSCPFTAFTSGGGGRGVSLCSSLYASYQASQGKRVILLGLDPYMLPTDPLAGMALLRKVTGGSALPVKAACVATENGPYVPAQSTERNLLHQLNEEDADAFFRGIEDSGEWDEAVLDVPRAYRFWESVMNMCEDRIVVVSGGKEQARLDETAFRELEDLAARSGGDRPARTWRFAPAWDDAVRSGQVDLYGQLGCEVKALAQQLAAR